MIPNRFPPPHPVTCSHDRRLHPGAGIRGDVPVEQLGGGRFSSLQQYLEPGRHRARLQGCRGLDHRGLVECVLSQLRDPAARHAGRAVLLYLRAGLRSRRRMVGTGLHVLARQGIHHQGHRELPGARLRPHRLLRGRHRRAARLDRATDRIQRADRRSGCRGFPARSVRAASGLRSGHGARPARRADRLRARRACRQPPAPGTKP